MNHIEKIVYINLDRREDRRKEMEEQLESYGLKDKTIRFPAFDTPHSGMFGCHLSHLHVMKMAEKEGWENVLVLEDDFEFIVDKETLERTLNKFFSLHISYDGLMLAYCLNKTQPYNEIVGKALYASNGAGYIIHKRVYRHYIELLEWSYDKLVETNDHSKYLNDQIWKAIQSKGAWFYFLERLGKQRASYSDLCLTFVDRGQ